MNDDIIISTFLNDEYYAHYNTIFDSYKQYLEAMDQNVDICKKCDKPYWKDCKKRCICNDYIEEKLNKNIITIA